MWNVNNKIKKTTAPILLTSIIFSSIIACSRQTNLTSTEEPAKIKSTETKTITNSETTIFNCIQQQDIWATIAQKRNNFSAPIITWQTE
ncbi:MAG: hypothetical protein SAJ37_18385 [Oscillatoria sp. PMC 1068.18]|nr:hypothetical protein [Oscillatoria sp. PMC 1076.18]MEC4990705.1 hypothetical protein [Oscillatoria sp. PMC 1068.18]